MNVIRFSWVLVAAIPVLKKDWPCENTDSRTSTQSIDSSLWPWSRILVSVHFLSVEEGADPLVVVSTLDIHPQTVTWGSKFPYNYKFYVQILWPKLHIPECGQLLCPARRCDRRRQGSGERREIWGGENLGRKEDTVLSFNSAITRSLQHTGL
jgi:hypothetical protein